jgi:hypothetical protein
VKREFFEETGRRPDGEFLPLGEAREPGGKMVHVWAVEGDWDAATLRSNMFEMEWPPPGGLVRCIDLPIQMKEKPCGRMSAKMSIKVKYGLQGDEDEESNFDAVLDIILQPDATQFQFFTNWNPNAPMQAVTLA